MDGYAYTRKKSGNRLWRKNMQPTPKSTCFGTDLNRNFGLGWDSGASSTNPCADDFRGPEAFSAPETLAIAAFMKSLSNLVSYIDFHA